MHAFLTTQSQQKRDDIHHPSTREKMTNTTNDDTKGVVARTRIDFEIDVDAICAIARSSREWLVAHESGAEALTVLKEAKEEL